MSRRRRRGGGGGGGTGLEYAVPGTFAANYSDIVAQCFATFGALPVLGWKAGDANIPSHWLGAANTATRLVSAGTIAARVSPYQDATGADIASEYHLAGSRATASAGVLDPAAGHDTYVAMLYKYPFKEATGAQAFFGNTIGAGRGFLIYCDAAGVTSFLAIGDASSTVAVTGVLSAWVLIQAIYDADGNLLLCLGGTENTAASPAGDIFPSGLALTIDGPTFSIQGSEVAWLVHYTGASVATLASAAHRAAMVQLASGVAPSVGAASTFTRASAASGIDRNGRHHIYFNGRPRAGDSEGIRIAPTRANKVYRNWNPANTTGYAVSGGTLTVEDDTAQLLADGLDCWGPMVYKMVPGAADRVVISGGASANTNAHSLQTLIRGAAGGETVTLCLRDTSDGSLVSASVITCTTAYQHIRAPNITPTDIDMQWCLFCEAGDELYFIGGQCEEGATCTSLIPGYAYAAGAVRAATTLDLAWTPSDVQGAISCTVAPVGWDDTEAADSTILDRVTGLGELLRADSAGGLATDDGTTEVRDTSVALADGVDVEATVSWGGSLDIVVDGTRTAGAYDGALQGSGLIRAEASVGEVALRDIRCYRRRR